MGWLNDHIGDAVTLHAFHGFAYIVDMYTVTLFQFFQDHFTGPGTVYVVLQKGLCDILFNTVDGFFSCIVVAGAKTYNEDGFGCYFLCCVHKVIKILSI